MKTLAAIWMLANAIMSIFQWGEDMLLKRSGDLHEIQVIGYLILAILLKPKEKDTE